MLRGGLRCRKRDPTGRGGGMGGIVSEGRSGERDLRAMRLTTADKIVLDTETTRDGRVPRGSG